MTSGERSAGLASAPGLTWGVKASFVSYVSSLDDGRVIATDGAEGAADSEFFFPFLGVDVESREPFAGSVRFGGTVEFNGHFGMMELTLRNPFFRMGPDACQLLADIRGQARPLASLAPREPERTEVGLTWRNWIPLLTAEGAREFRDSYAPGEELAPVSLSVPVEQSW